MKIQEDVQVSEVRKMTTGIQCDVCKKIYEYNGNDDWIEIQEFTSIKFRGGYGSIFGDGNDVEIDICQHCLKEKLDKYIRIKTYE